MSQPLRVLVLEDSVIDADLVIRELRRAGYEPQWTRAETEADFLAALATEPEVILADYSMPHFDGLRAVQHLRAMGSDIPFILVSGMQGEDVAVEAMKQGATDYLLKDRITRLGSAVERALEEKRLRDERRRMDTKLHESEERLRLALHAAHLGTFDWDVPHNRIIWSRWHEELWGFQPGEFAGTYEVFAGRVHPDDLPGINAEVARCIAAREPFLREFRVVWPDGSVHWIAGRGEFTFDEGGQPVRMRGVVREITARKQAEGALRISDLALKAVSQGVIITGPDRRITSVNAAFVAITGYPAAEILGRNCRFLQGPDTDPATVAAIRAALGGSGGFAGEILNYRRDGTPFWNDVTISAVRDEAGRPSHFIGITRDITRRKLAEQGMARVSRLYVVLSRINEMIVRTSEATALFEGACRIAVEHGHFRLAAIFGVDAATGEVRPVAHFDAELGYFREMRVNLADPNLNQGTIGTAIRTGRYDVCNDFARDAGMAAWQAPLAQRGYRSGASFPIRHGKDIFGALVLFSAETGIFEDEEIKLLTAVADDVSFAIEAMDREGKRKRAEAALRESEVTMATAQQIAHLGSWELDLTGEDIDANPLRWSDEMFRIAGFAPGAVRVTNDLFFSLIPSDEHESIRQAVAAAIREHGQYFLVHRLIRPDGTTRIVHEMAQVTYDGQTGRPLKLVGTAHDITERKQAEDERDRLFNIWVAARLK